MVIDTTKTNFDFLVDFPTFYQGAITLTKGYFETMSNIGTANYKACTEAFTTYGDLTKSVFQSWALKSHI